MPIHKYPSPEAYGPLEAQFLDLLARDIADHPERLLLLDIDLVRRWQSLVGSIEFDLTAALAPRDE